MRFIDSLQSSAIHQLEVKEQAETTQFGIESNGGNQSIKPVTGLQPSPPIYQLPVKPMGIGSPILNTHRFIALYFIEYKSGTTALASSESSLELFHLIATHATQSKSRFACSSHLETN